MKASIFARLSAIAGFTAAALLIVNVFRRGGVIPETALTHAIAPFAPLTGMIAIIGLYVVYQQRTGLLGLTGYLLNTVGLAGAFAIEYTLHFVFPALDKDVVARLVAGGTGMAFQITSVVLILGVVTFGAALLRTGELSSVAVVLYVVGMVPGALRTLVPLPVYLGGLVIAAIGIAWLVKPMWSKAGVVSQPAA